MSRRLIQAGLVLVAAFAAAQLIRPGRTNPPTDASRTIQALVGPSSDLGAVLDRSCGDCHSNQTAWPWYTQVAPVSWLMAAEVAQGRRAVNCSDWAGYSPQNQRALLEASCRDATGGKMPGPYTFVRPETRLSAEDIATICAAAQQTDQRAAGGR